MTELSDEDRERLRNCVRDAFSIENEQPDDDSLQILEVNLPLLLKENDRLRAQRDEAVEALRPFAETASEYCTQDRPTKGGVSCSLLVADLEEARTVYNNLTTTGEQTDG